MPLTQNPDPATPARHATALVLAVLLALQTGCASLEPKAPRPELQATLGQVAVVAAPVSAEIRLEGFPGGPVSGAVQGAAGGFVCCLAGAAKGSCTGAVCGATAVLAIGVCGVAAAVGAAAGAAAAPAPRDVERARETLLASLSADTVQTSLRDEVLGAAAARGPAQKGPGSQYFGDPQQDPGPRHKPPVLGRLLMQPATGSEICSQVFHPWPRGQWPYRSWPVPEATTRR